MGDEINAELSTEQRPHYMLPNFVSILPEYSNCEGEHIRQAFSTGNYHSISKMPTKIAPTEISKTRQLNIDQNRQAGVSVNHAKIVTKCGLFSQFEYVPSRYSLVDEFNRAERMESQSKRLQIGGKDFVCSSDVKKMKHEEAFSSKNQSYPYMSEPYEQSHNEELRTKWIQEKKILHGPFISSGNARVLDTPTRKLLPNIIKDLHDAIAMDWVDISFDISLTEDDAIAARFDMKTIENEKGLAAYMNVFARTHDLMSKYSLKKFLEDWNSKPGDGGLYFVFRPPWVKLPAKHR